MLKVAKAERGEHLKNSRTKQCSLCDNKWEKNAKTNWSRAWACGFPTWINRTVILLSMLNVIVGNRVLDWSVDDENAHYSRQWAVNIEGGLEAANRIAAKHNFINLGKIFENFYHFEHKRLAKRSLLPHAEFHRNLVDEIEVKWAKQQIVKKRSKRDLIALRPRSKSNSVKFNDIEWPTMWYLNRGQGLDMNVQGAWREGISGSGVVVTILDDGLESTHPDLMANYDPQASYDVNNHDEDPMPRYDSLDSNRHGTRCAGEVAAVANNSLCSVGVAFGASVGDKSERKLKSFAMLLRATQQNIPGIHSTSQHNRFKYLGVRMLDGDVTDAVEARSLSLNPQHIDIYSASWGPDDDGKTVDGPGELATRAFIEGVTKGRQGKGSIFVWASGNGGREHDNCNCDGYTNSIWTLSISSATEKGLVPWYSEACSSTLATTYSSGAVNEKQIVTTDLRHKCTNGHTGTSASAPLAAGICALALEANKDLTWRDMQHIVVRTARPANLKSSDWKVNGVGRNVSHSFGYGLMDATAMVRLARIWKTVPEQHKCEIWAPHVDKPIPPRSKVILKLNVTECAGVNFLEHVQAKISLSSAQRGGLQIYLTSPAGTRATLLARRPQDFSRNPFFAWPFMSVHTWGEKPFGVWQLEIHYEGHFMGRAVLQEWSLLFYGTKAAPMEMPSEKLHHNSHSPAFSIPKVSSRSNYTNSQPYKLVLNSSSNHGRKFNKIWRGKPANSRMGKFSGGDSNSAFKISTAKTEKKNLHQNKYKNLSTEKEIRRTTRTPPLAHNMPLTIVLGPGGDSKTRQKVPDIFQKYPKVEQLFPLYLNGNRSYNEDNILTSHIDSPVFSSFSKAKQNSETFSHDQKAERQNRFDISSLTRTYGGKKFKGNALLQTQTPRKQQIQGYFEGWEMLFYGTEIAPNEEFKETGTRIDRPNGKPKTVAVEETHLSGSSKNRAEISTSTSTACASYSKSAYRCLECYFGLYLYDGRCEAICPPETYPGRSADKKAVCLPCHYTCLTCAGESEAHCRSCREDAVPAASGFTDSNGVPPPQKTKSEHVDFGEVSFESWGKRASMSKDAITKKILEPYERPLYYCYQMKMFDRIKNLESRNQYMTVFFALNLVFLFGTVAVIIWRKYFVRKEIREEKKGKMNELTWKYLRMENNEADNVSNGERTLDLSSSSDEEKDCLSGFQNQS